MNEKLLSLYQYICWFATIITVTYSIYIFILNEDLCTIEYKTYYEEKMDVFPELSFCIKNAISETKLQQYSSKFDIASYIDFLDGNIFDSEMLKIDFESVIKNLSDYIEPTWVDYRNGTFLNLHPSNNNVFPKAMNVNKVLHLPTGNFPFSNAFFSYYLDNAFLSCYCLTIPQNKNVRAYYFGVDNSIFEDGIRSKTNYDLVTFLHYPNQMLTSISTMKYFWPQDRKANDTYIMKFNIRGAETLRRRQKGRRPCNENWKDYDNEIKREHAKIHQCRPPYMNFPQHISICSNQSQIKKAKFIFRSDGYGVSPPCTLMENIHYDYEESTIEDVSWAYKGRFSIMITLDHTSFKEISQTRYLFYILVADNKIDRVPHESIPRV